MRSRVRVSQRPPLRNSPGFSPSGSSPVFFACFWLYNSSLKAVSGTAFFLMKYRLFTVDLRKEMRGQPFHSSCHSRCGNAGAAVIHQQSQPVQNSAVLRRSGFGKKKTKKLQNKVFWMQNIIFILRPTRRRHGMGLRRREERRCADAGARGGSLVPDALVRRKQRAGT